MNVCMFVWLLFQSQSWVRCSESLRKLPGIVSSLVEGAHTATTASTMGAADEGGYRLCPSTYRIPPEQFLPLHPIP